MAVESGGGKNEIFVSSREKAYGTYRHAGSFLCMNKTSDVGRAPKELILVRTVSRPAGARCCSKREI